MIFVIRNLPPHIPPYIRMTAPSALVARTDMGSTVFERDDVTRTLDRVKSKARALLETTSTLILTNVPRLHAAQKLLGGENSPENPPRNRKRRRNGAEVLENGASENLQRFETIARQIRYLGRDAAPLLEHWVIRPSTLGPLKQDGASYMSELLRTKLTPEMEKYDVDALNEVIANGERSSALDALVSINSSLSRLEKDLFSHEVGDVYKRARTTEARDCLSSSNKKEVQKFTESEVKSGSIMYDLFKGNMEESSLSYLTLVQEEE